MKTVKIGATVLSVLLGVHSVAAQEITLFDSEGEAIAYIDAADADWTIYLWDGTPVAYLDSEGDAFAMYGFNGKHLGWYEDGMVRDRDGSLVGFREGRAQVYTRYPPYKSAKQYKPYPAYREPAAYKPYYSNQFSSEPLLHFLRKGRR